MKNKSKLKSANIISVLLCAVIAGVALLGFSKKEDNSETISPITVLSTVDNTEVENPNTEDMSQTEVGTEKIVITKPKNFKTAESAYKYSMEHFSNVQQKAGLHSVYNGYIDVSWNGALGASQYINVVQKYDAINDLGYFYLATYYKGAPTSFNKNIKEEYYHLTKNNYVTEGTFSVNGNTFESDSAYVHQFLCKYDENVPSLSELTDSNGMVWLSVFSPEKMTEIRKCVLHNPFFNLASAYPANKFKNFTYKTEKDENNKYENYYYFTLNIGVQEVLGLFIETIKSYFDLESLRKLELPNTVDVTYKINKNGEIEKIFFDDILIKITGEITAGINLTFDVLLKNLTQNLINLGTKPIINVPNYALSAMYNAGRYKKYEKK